MRQVVHTDDYDILRCYMLQEIFNEVYIESTLISFLYQLGSITLLIIKLKKSLLLINIAIKLAKQ